MKVLLDTCVLYPTVMREVLLGVAKTGLFQPLWSQRILDEWSRAAIKLGPAGQVQADAEIAMVSVAWPKAQVRPPAGLLDRLWLPDQNDIHVLAAAIAGNARQFGPTVGFHGDIPLSGHSFYRVNDTVAARSEEHTSELQSP